jgi:putative hydrolase
MIPLENVEIARRLEEVASLIHAQKGSPYRVRAYRRGAQTLRDLSRSAAAILEQEGVEGLLALPGIGETIARSIRDLLKTGTLPALERLRGEADPVLLLATVPGISRRMADRIHYLLGVSTLEDLETAAHDGRLTEFLNIRGRRLNAIQDSLARRLLRVRRIGESPPAPPVEDLLGIDREYREKAQAGILPTIAPRRFNPEGRAWLPLLHAERGQRRYTALYSNTARAHELGMTRDWVVIYFEGGQTQGQCTVITGRRGAMVGKRFIVGRDEECLRYYAGLSGPDTAGELKAG